MGAFQRTIVPGSLGDLSTGVNTFLQNILDISYAKDMEYQSPDGVIKRVGEYLSKPLSLDTSVLIEQLTGLEACRFELADKTAEWHKLVAEYRNRMLHPKDKDFTELDRNVMLDAHVAVVRRDYEFLCKLEELVGERLQFGKLLLTLNQNTI